MTGAERTTPAARQNAPDLVFPTEPWGRYRPPALTRLALALTRSLAFPLLKQLALGIRRLVRPGLDWVDVELWGYRLRLAAQGNLTEGRLIFVPRSWDPVERKAIRAFAAPGMTFVDIGANAGGYVWWVLSLLGRSCRILAVEPDPLLVASLEFNLKTNRADNAQVLPVAIGTEAGTQLLMLNSSNRGENRLRGPGPGESAGHVVRVCRLEEALHEAGLSRVDILKIDIEGLEVDVVIDFLATAPRPLWPGMLIIERLDTPAHDRLEASLTQAGYEISARGKRNIIGRLADK